MTRPTDEELMVRFCEGDERAFEALYERHAEGVLGFITRIVGDPELASDLLQLTFLSLIRSTDRFQRGARFKPWLYTIAGNAARDVWRQRRRVRAATKQLARETERAVVAPFPDPGLQRAMARALESLSSEQREAVVLHQLLGWSFPEIAELAGITETAARLRAHRGYERLRELLAPEEA